MEVFLNLTKKYIKCRSKHMKEHWYSNSRLLKLYNPMPNKSLEACIDLLDGDSKFSITVKDWLHKEVNKNSLNIEDLRNWITHVKTHILKLKGRIYYLLILTGIFVFCFSLLPLNKYTIVIVITILLISIEKGLNNGIQSSLNELILYLEREIESMEKNQT